MSTLGTDCKPYRVEWRAHLLSTRWLLVTPCSDHDKAQRIAADFSAKHGGQTRVIAQHTIHVEGLGSDWSSNAVDSRSRSGDR